MNELAWLLPIIFLFHDFEEIIGAKIWLHNNRDLIKSRYPTIYKISKDFSTEGFALAVFEELVLCIVICIAAITINTPAVWGVWLGAFMALTLHFAIHIVQAVIFRGYIPALATSIVCIPPSIWIIDKSLEHLADNINEIYLYIGAGLLLAFANLLFIHKAMGVFTRYINKNCCGTKI